MKYIVFLLSGAVLSASYYFEYGLGLKPCPLCIMQRVCIFWILCFSGLMLISPLFKKFKKLIVLQNLGVMAGLYFSIRQLWLQSLPPEQAPACMPDLSILMQYFPIQDIIHTLIWGAGDCAKVTWVFMGFSMAFYSTLYFVAVGLLSLWQFKFFSSLTRLD